MLSREEQRTLRGTIFRHLDGLVTAPTMVALTERGVGAALLEGPADLDELARRFDASDGYLNVALRTLASQGWLEHRARASGEGVEVETTPAGRIAFEHGWLYRDVVDFMKYSGEFHPRRFELAPFRRMEEVRDRSRERYGIEPTDDIVVQRVRDQIFAHIEGALFAPTVVRLGMSGMFHKYFTEASFRPEEFHEDGESFGRLLRMFEELGWFTERNGTFRFTDRGLFFARRASAYGVTVSYLPTLRRLDELIFGDPLAVRSAPDGPETHVDRETNVWGSGGAHAAYFREIDDIIVELFDRPIDEQPRGIVDMGCGNGAFLEHLFDVIDSRTARGRVLEDHPLFLVGVDFNETALRVTRQNLARADIWAKVIWGDVGRPDRLADDLREDYGIELRDLLNVRTFLDHNRPWEPPAPHDRVATSTGAFAHLGSRLDNADVEQSLVEHLRRWAPYLERFGLLVIELHTLPPALAARHVGETPVTAYDATHGYSDQYIVETDVFERIVEEAGLRTTPSCARRFPDSELATVTIHLLQRSPRTRGAGVRRPRPAG
ncbi:MAG: class I SAM-dependent methyltransferase [Gemmatimonadota bacterium]|nr:class I SAM-dependent methyltransferase [Gemmatimonadota bacterium]